MTSRYLALSTLLATVCLVASGCSSWMELKAGAPLASAPADKGTPVEVARIPAVLSSITVSQNGAAMPPAGELERRVLDSLAETQLFSRLIYPGYLAQPPAEPHVRAKLAVTLTPNPHAGSAAWKGIVIGASMFLLTPVLPLDYEYGASVTLDLEREDGATHRYSTHAEGIAHYHLFGATHLAADELKAKVIDTCFTQLQRQLVQDRTFVQAGMFAKHTPEPRIPDNGVYQTLVPLTKPSRTSAVLRPTLE